MKESCTGPLTILFSNTKREACIFPDSETNLQCCFFERKGSESRPL